MTEVFLKIVNMSISASWLVLAILVLRLLLKKAPKWVNVLLWGIVAVRLLCPFSIESALSLIPSAEVISPEIMVDRTPEITTGIYAINSIVNPVITETFAPDPAASANPLQIWIPILSAVWAAGVAVMLAYTAVSYFRLRRKVRDALPLREKIYRSAHIPSPFVLGIRKPEIYLPTGMDEAEMAHVIAHEQAHIRRRDHWWKPLGFLLLTIHWFNPLMWAAYILLCRDIELACDEKVIKELGRDQRADYSQALLSCSVNRPMIAACPLAFGEVGVKERVKNVLNYKKPAFWVIVIAVILCVAVAVCFLTNPAPSREFAMEGDNVADLDPQKITDAIAEIEDLEDGSVLCVNAENFSLNLTSDFEWADSGAIRFFYYRDQREYSAQLRIFREDDQFYVTESEAWLEQNRIFKLYHYLQALKYMPQDEIRQMCSDGDGYIVSQLDEGIPGSYDRVITYTAEGAGEIDGWLIHLELQPLHTAGDAYTGTGDETIHLFYGENRTVIPATVTQWVDNVDTYPESSTAESEIQPDAFPGVTFRYTYGQITSEDEAGETVLIGGMPIWNAYLTDLTGDSIPEICATVSFGSGLVDAHVVVYDYVNGQEYTLWERGEYDYYLRLEDGRLICDKFTYGNGGPMDKGTLVASGELVLADAGGGDGKRLVISEDRAKERVMVPTDADVHGVFGEYLYRTIDGKNYRYERQSAIPEGITRGAYLETLLEDDSLGTTCRWDVYAVEGCTDNTLVIAQSPDVDGVWLYQYSPSKGADEGALQAARDGGYVIMEDGNLTSGQDAWYDFYEATQNGNAASVKVVHYYTLDPETTADITYEAYQEDYPKLFTLDLSYDGQMYTLRWEENGTEYIRTYEYLMKYGDRTMLGVCTHYVLTHDNTVTWEQIFNGMVSSMAGQYIDHYTVCTEYQ